MGAPFLLEVSAPNNDNYTAKASVFNETINFLYKLEAEVHFQLIFSPGSVTPTKEQNYTDFTLNIGVIISIIAFFLVGVFFITLIYFCVCVHKRNVSSINEKEEKDGIYNESSVVGITMTTNAAYGYL